MNFDGASFGIGVVTGVVLTLIVLCVVTALLPRLLESASSPSTRSHPAAAASPTTSPDEPLLGGYSFALETDSDRSSRYEPPKQPDRTKLRASRMSGLSFGTAQRYEREVLTEWTNTMLRVSWEGKEGPPPSVTAVERDLDNGIHLMLLLNVLQREEDGSAVGSWSGAPLNPNAKFVNEKRKNLAVVRMRMGEMGLDVAGWKVDDIVQHSTRAVYRLLYVLVADYDRIMKINSIAHVKKRLGIPLDDSDVFVDSAASAGGGGGGGGNRDSGASGTQGRSSRPPRSELFPSKSAPEEPTPLAGSPMLNFTMRAERGSGGDSDSGSDEFENEDSSRRQPQVPARPVRPSRRGGGGGAGGGGGRVSGRGPASPTGSSARPLPSIGEWSGSGSSSGGGGVRRGGSSSGSASGGRGGRGGRASRSGLSSTTTSNTATTTPTPTTTTSTAAGGTPKRPPRSVASRAMSPLGRERPASTPQIEVDESNQAFIEGNALLEARLGATAVAKMSDRDKAKYAKLCDFVFPWTNEQLAGSGLELKCMETDLDGGVLLLTLLQRMYPNATPSFNKTPATMFDRLSNVGAIQEALGGAGLDTQICSSEDFINNNVLSLLLLLGSIQRAQQR